LANKSLVVFRLLFRFIFVTFRDNITDQYHSHNPNLCRECNVSIITGPINNISLHLTFSYQLRALQRLGYGLHNRGIVVRFPAGETISPPKYPDQLWGPPFRYCTLFPWAWSGGTWSCLLNPFRAEVKNKWSYTSILPYMPSLRAHGQSFNFSHRGNWKSLKKPAIKGGREAQCCWGQPDCFCRIQFKYRPRPSQVWNSNLFCGLVRGPHVEK